MNSSAQVVKLRPNAKSKATDPFIERYHQSVNSPEYTHFFKEYPLGVSWKLTGEVLLRDLIASGKSPVEKIHTLQDTLLFSVDQDDRQLQELTFQCWNRFFEKRGTPLLSLPEELQESKFCLNRKAFEWKNRHYSLDFFSKLNLTLEIAEATKAGLHPESFLEIGAGFGQLARLIKLKYPKGRYAILDLPEALYFSSNYLFLNFPQAKHVWANDERELKRALEEADYDFLYVPAPLSQCLKQSKFEFDAAVNKSSFGEMNNKSSGYYIELLQKHLNVKYVFLLNRFLNSMDPDLQSYRREENQWFNDLDDKWKCLKWEIEPEFTRFPYNEVLHHRELFLVAERVPFSLPAQPIGDILCQKWYACFTKIPFARHSNIIAVDLGKEGVLERLVNSVRVSPTKPGLDALIKYIFLLEGKFPIEERFYYTKLYKKLFHKRHFLAAANPLRVYTLAKRILALFGAGFFLRRPQLIAWSVQMLRAVGINPAGIYHFLKKHLFNETDKTPSSEGPGTFQIKSD